MKLTLALVLVSTIASSVFLIRSVFAQSVPPPVYGCATKGTGALRQVSGAGQCNTSVEDPVQWNFPGPPGPHGWQGATGDEGPAGPAGPGGADPALSGWRIPLSGERPELTGDEVVVGSISVDPGTYFVTATITIRPPDVPSLFGGHCEIQSGGQWVDGGHVGNANARPAHGVRQIITLHGAARIDPGVPIQVLCSSNWATIVEPYSRWADLRIAAVRVSEARTVHLGTY